MSGVKIHNGSVVAAGSSVTKDVPPYAIVAGNPAKIIKFRFDVDQIHALLEIRWWDWDEAKIKSEAINLWSNKLDDFIQKHI